MEIKILRDNLKEALKNGRDFFSFDFTFDNWVTDNCIVYNIKKSEKWTCNSGYIIGSPEYKDIQNAIYKIIKREGK